MPPHIWPSAVQLPEEQISVFGSQVRPAQQAGLVPPHAEPCGVQLLPVQVKRLGSQVSPAQHGGWVPPHAAPVAPQLPPEQSPPTQLPEQHSAFVMHCPPLPVHMPLEQTPLEQTLGAQQSLL